MKSLPFFSGYVWRFDARPRIELGSNLMALSSMQDQNNYLFNESLPAKVSSGTRPCWRAKPNEE